MTWKSKALYADSRCCAGAGGKFYPAMLFASWLAGFWMFIRCGRATVYSWRRLSPGVSNGLLNEDLSLAINGFVMRPRLRDLSSLPWFGLDHRRSR